MNRVLANVSAVAIDGRVVLIEGPPGCGKSSLALDLIDRGAMLVGDDAVSIDRIGDTITASPPPNTCGLIEIRNVGIVQSRTANGIIALVLSLDLDAPRFPEAIDSREIEDVAIPVLPFSPGDSIQALRAEHALRMHGLIFPTEGEKA